MAGVLLAPISALTLAPDTALADSSGEDDMPPTQVQWQENNQSNASAILATPANTASASTANTKANTNGDTHVSTTPGKDDKDTDADLPIAPTEPLENTSRQTPAHGKEPDKPSIASRFWPWSNQQAKQLPPEFKPYRLPTMEDDGRSHNDALAPLIKAPAINPDAVFASVMSCYPSPSNFNIDVELMGQLRTKLDSDDLFNTHLSTTEIGSNYVGIVARMPIYSYTELDRERDREFKRRTTAAGSVAKFVAAVAERNHAIRELALHRSLEARAAIRVRQGIVSASEQVTYLEKVASGQRALIQAEADIMESRLSMAALCDPMKMDRMNGYLKKVSAVPTREPKPERE